MDNNKYGYYYKKVLDNLVVSKKTKKKENCLFPWERKAIKEGLNNIIKNNYEHILTDSFINYLSSDSSIGFNFEKLSGDENDVIFILTYYFQSITGQYTFTPNNKDSKFGFVNLLEGDIKAATHDAYYYKEKSTEYKLDDALLCILAYCYMNKCIDKYKDYCEYVFNNQIELLDHIKLNDMMEGPEGWYTFINNYINDHFNSKKKVIK